MVQALNLREGRLQTVPLGLVPGAADGFGDGVFEGAVVGPELEFLERGTAGEELWKQISDKEGKTGGGDSEKTGVSYI